MPIYQHIIVRDNGETFVTWAETKELALEEFHSRGFNDEYKVLTRRDRTMPVIAANETA